MIKKTLGILGGMGPAASAKFYSLITDFTKADKDQDHLNIILRSTPTIPDRSAFILDESDINPFEKIRSEICAHAEAGSEIIAVACNTAEYFYSKLQNIIAVPILPISKIAVSYAKHLGYRRIGILATQGMCKAGLYQTACCEYGLEYKLPSAKNCEILNEIIYNYIKKALPIPDIFVTDIAEELYLYGCDCLILGCTELSLMGDFFKKRNYNYLDSLETLAAKCVLICGGDLSFKADRYIKNKNWDEK